MPKLYYTSVMFGQVSVTYSFEKFLVHPWDVVHEIKIKT